MFGKIKKLLKSLIIEGLAWSVAFVTEQFILDEDSGVVLKTAFSLRMYYLSKNILHFFKSKNEDENSTTHFYAGLYNTGIAASLFPAEKFIHSSNIILEQLSKSSLIYISGITLRHVIEYKNEPKSLKQHISIHAGKMLAATSSIPLSLCIPTVAVPALYWSGGVVDLIKNRGDKKISEAIFSDSSIVPLQVLFAFITKLSINQLSIPGYTIDVGYGVLFQLLNTLYAFTDCDLTEEAKENKEVTELNEIPQV